MAESTPALPTEKTLEQITKEEEEYERLAQLHDSYPPIWLTPTIQIGPELPKDREALVHYLNMPAIHDYLWGPPNPYLPSDADDWIRDRVYRMTKKGTPLTYSIRDMARRSWAIGNVSATDVSDEDLSGDDTGYWLAPEYHGQGLMAKALKMMLYRVSILEAGKRKFNGLSVENNWASRRTIEKVGFVYQPDIKRTVVKNGKEIGTWAYRLYLTEEDVANWEPVPEATPLPELISKT